MASTPDTTTRTSAFARLFEALASVRLGVVIMVVLAVLSAWATVYESRHGTAAAQREFYRTGWFALLLTILGVNVLLSMLKRYPWQSHQTGFVMAHVGIVALLVGSLISLHFGLDSNLALYEGETGERAELLDQALEVALPGHEATFPVAFEKDTPCPGHERRFAIPGSETALVVEEFQPHVRVTNAPAQASGATNAWRVVTPEPPPEKESRRIAAVKVRLHGPEGRSEPEWVLWTERRSVALGSGVATVAFRPLQVELPFRVTLLKFNAGKYPGSGMAATYESWVRVEDPERGIDEYHISMNHPLHYRGYVFFQASYVEGQPMMSIFSVTRAPGLPLVYLGIALIGAGVAWMFYVKPYLARRQAARALAARLSASHTEGRPASQVVAARAGAAQAAA